MAIMDSLPERSLSLEAELNVFNPNLPLAEAYTPPASWYNWPEFLDLEKSKVFGPSLQLVGTIDRLPESGSYFTGDFMGWPYVVLRTDLGEIKAFFNVCAHHGSCVAQRAGRVRQLVCPYHGWTYDLDGKLRKAPHAGNIGHFLEAGLALKPIPLRTQGRFIALCFAGQTPEPAALKGFAALAGLDHPNLRFVNRREYALPCNWKVFIDNYLDGGYHVAHLHKDLAADLALDGYTSEVFPEHVIQSCDGKADETSRIGERAAYLWLYPNFCANRYGSWLDTNWVIPTGSSSCRVIFEYFHVGEILDSDLAKALASSDQVQREDIFICEQVQRGLQSGVYNRGIYAPRFEKPMYRFHQRLAEALQP